MRNPVAATVISMTSKQCINETSKQRKEGYIEGLILMNYQKKRYFLFIDSYIHVICKNLFAASVNPNKSLHQLLRHATVIKAEGPCPESGVSGPG